MYIPEYHVSGAPSLMIRETTAAVTAPTLIIVIRDIQPPNVRATVKCQINYTEKTLKSDFTKVPNFTTL